MLLVTVTVVHGDFVILIGSVGFVPVKLATEILGVKRK